jgi:glutathione S-transferase
MYTVVGSVASRTFRVVWLLEELGQPYTVIPAKPHGKAVRAHSNLGKIPVLLDGPVTVSDSLAIMTYLADKHAGLTAQAGTPERAAQDAMTFRLLDELESVIWTYARHTFVLPEAERVPEVLPSLQLEFMRNLDRLTSEIQSPFLMGEHITLPDLLLVHLGNWARSARFPDAPAAFLDYARPFRARSAYQRTMAQRKT